jgi:A/G-specific adenine glycosylase
MMPTRARTTIEAVMPQVVRRAMRASPTVPSMAIRERDGFRRALLDWYGRHGRDLPWRQTGDPYRIWLSEIMLQQTRVAAVLNHYQGFLERFPRVEALAAASEEAVLAAWSGLGYYRRARLLHRCAKEVVRKFGRRFPPTAVALQRLPGIGRYTAAAIASIAFAEPVAVVDGNVERVLQRLAAARLNTAQLWQQAQMLLAGSEPGDFNQAMMELGATVCVPREPRCPLCPVRKYCATSRRRASPPSPAPAPGRQLKKEIWCVFAERRDAVRLVQRPKSAALMPGMWELPQLPKSLRSLPAAASWRSFRHSITITDYTVHVLRNLPATRQGQARKAFPAAQGKWIAIARIPQIPITGLTRKILKAGGVIE